MQTIIEGDGYKIVEVSKWDLGRAIALRGAIQMWRDHKIIVTRGMTISKIMAMTSEMTGADYRRGQYEAAIDDLNRWIETTKAAMAAQQQTTN